MVKWTEVNAYSGMPVDEDAPTNATGAAVSTDVPIVKKKKKKTFLDARTKAWKEHQKRLEASRARREERKKAASKINEEQIDEVNVTFIKKFAADMKKDKTFRPFADKFMKLAMKGGSPRDALEKAVPDYIEGKEIEKLISKNRMSAVFGEDKPKTFSQKVQEQISGFGREAFLAENNMDVIKSIVKSKGAKDLKMKDGKMMVDMFTASAIMNVYNKVNPNNKQKMEKLANGTRADLGKLQRLAMKFA